MLDIKTYEKQVNETAEWIKNHTEFRPKVAIVLGTGLGHLAKEIDVVDAIAYGDIPNFPVSTVQGHSGRLLFGWLGGKQVMALEGRFHYYEGYTMQQVTFPQRVMAALGMKYLFVSNAAGGVNPSFEIGDIMLITDHINFMPEHPLHGPNYPGGDRFPDMHEPYSHELLAQAREIAKEKGIKVVEGVYVGTQGPTFETPAEYRMYYRLGADTVGMSTVPEVIVAKHAGMTCFGISVVTDLGMEETPVEVSHEEVQAAADKVQPFMAEIFRELIKRMDIEG